MKYSSSRPQLFVLIRVIRGLSRKVDSRHASVFIRPECDAETHSGLHFYPLIIRVLSVFRVRNNHCFRMVKQSDFCFSAAGFFLSLKIRDLFLFQ